MENFVNKIPGLQVKKESYGFCVEGKISLSCWSGFQSRLGAYGGQDSSKASTGVVTLGIGGDVPPEEGIVTQEHFNAYQHLVQHQQEIQSKMLETLLSEYKNIRHNYGFDISDEDNIMPDVSEVSQFRTLIGLSTVHIMNISRDGIAYVGYEFGCPWDPDHGIGFMTHKNRIVEFGGGDTSFLTWVAKKDLQKEII